MTFNFYLFKMHFCLIHVCSASNHLAYRPSKPEIFIVLSKFSDLLILNIFLRNIQCRLSIQHKENIRWLCR